MRRLDPRALALPAFTVLLVAAGCVLSAGNEDAFDTVLYGTLALSLAAVGALVVTREPRNPIGWLLCGLGLWNGLGELAQGTSYLAAARTDGGEYGEWVISWSWIVGIASLVVSVLRFPDGRLPGRRWRWLPALVPTALAVAFVGQAFSPETGERYTSGENPFAVDSGLVLATVPLGMALLAAALVLAAVASVGRFRRARGVERLQLKWFAFAGGLLALTGLVAVPMFETSLLAQVLVGVALNTVPLAIGVAILRYRLYDVDLLINRTLVYGALTATLGGAYLGLVLLIGLAIGRSSDMAIAASTLAVAALFGPARRRIQALVDRRFYRRRYDAARTLERLGGRLRDETDLEALGDDLRGVARETLQPAHVSLWLREGRS